MLWSPYGSILQQDLGTESRLAKTRCQLEQGSIRKWGSEFQEMGPSFGLANPHLALSSRAVARFFSVTLTLFITNNNQPDISQLSTAAAALTS